MSFANGQPGTLITAAGGVGFDLLLFSVNVDIAKYTQGWGTLENAADRTRPHIIPLDDGKKMLTFIDDSRDRAEYNGATLYYSIFDGTYWSIPKAVADDGTPDSIHTLKKIGDKVIIAWTDVINAFGGEETSREKLSSIGISWCNIHDTNQHNV